MLQTKRVRTTSNELPKIDRRHRNQTLKRSRQKKPRIAIRNKQKSIALSYDKNSKRQTSKNRVRTLGAKASPVQTSKLSKNYQQFD